MCVDGNLKVSKEQVTCIHRLTFGIETIKNGFFILSPHFTKRNWPHVTKLIDLNPFPRMLFFLHNYWSLTETSNPFKLSAIRH